MLRILDRYLLRQLVTSTLAVAFILLLIAVGGTLADVLSRVARGRLPADLLFSLIGLRLVDALTILLPLAVFLGVLLAYGRMWRDSEMAVLQASGVSVRGLMRPLAIFVLPLTVLLALVSFWLAPASVRLAQHMTAEANRSLIVAGLEAGRFVDLPGNNGVLYVARMSDDGTRFEHMFVESERQGEDGRTRIDVITANSGFLYHDANGQDRYLALQDGFRVEGIIGQDDFRLMRFERNDIRLPEADRDDGDTKVKRAARNAVLLASDDPLQRAELHWRLSSPLSALVLVLLAVPLARTDPRAARYARLLLAVLCYLVYANFIGLGRSWLGQGDMPLWLGLWWVYLPTVMLALWLLWRGENLRAPRRRRGSS